jgi:geranylgeranyl pyrophosphate synthase
MQRAPKGERNDILAMIRNGGGKMKVKTIVDFVQSYRGIDYAEEQARRYATQAASRLDPFPDSPARAALLGFASFVIDREK